MILEKAIEIVRPSVVQIRLQAFDRDGTFRQQWGKSFLSQPIGTGFLVNEDGIVITANHVLVGGAQAAGKLPDASLHVGLAQRNTSNMRANVTTVPFDVLLQDDLHDVAVLKLRQNPFRGEVRSGIRIGDTDIAMEFAVAKLDPDRPADGTAIATSGYPLDTLVLVTTSGHIASSWAYEMKEVQVPDAPMPFTMPRVSDAYIGDVEVNPGNSGGPVYRVADGSVIGVCVATRLSPLVDANGQPVPNLAFTTGLCIIVPTSYVTESLEKVGAAWERAS